MTSPPQQDCLRGGAAYSCSLKTVLGGVVELQARQDVAGLPGGEGLVEGSGGVGVEIVLDHADALGVG